MASVFESPVQSEPEQAPSEEHQLALVRSVLLGQVTAEHVCRSEGLTGDELTEWIRRHRRAARRAIDEQIATVLAAYGLEKDDFVLSGNLESMALSDLLEGIQLGRKNAHIRIDQGGEHSHLWCADGDVIDAQAGGLRGTRAVYHMLSLCQGRLQAEFASEVRERTIVAPTEALLVEFARQVDECKRLREQIGDMTQVCVPNANGGTLGALEAEHADLLRAFDGARSIAEVVAGRGRPELETLASVARLLAKRRLLVVPAPASSPVSTVIEPVSMPAPSSGLRSAVSVPPIAPSLVSGPQLARWARQVQPLARRYGPFAAAALAIPAAFAAGFWNERASAPPSQPAAVAAPPWVASLAPTLCGPDMTFLPGGAAAPGAPPESSNAARPFCLAQRPVSTQEYQACVTSQHCEPAAAARPAAPGAPQEPLVAACNAGQPGREHEPINCVTYQQAEQYCEWRGQRLPLAAEWEFAWRSSRAANLAGSGGLPGGHAGNSSPFSDISEWTTGSAARLAPGAAPSADAPLHAMMGARISEGSVATGAVSSRRLTNAGARAKSLGFRCALSLAASAALPPPELVRPNGDGSTP